LESVSNTFGGTFNTKYYAGGLVGINLGTIDNIGLQARPLAVFRNTVGGGFVITPQAGPGRFVVNMIGANLNIIEQRGIMAGGVVGYNAGKVNNVVSAATLNNANILVAGGVVGHNGIGGEISNATRSVTAALASGFYTGGIVGLYEGAYTLTDDNGDMVIHYEGIGLVIRIPNPGAPNRVDITLTSTDGNRSHFLSVPGHLTAVTGLPATSSALLISDAFLGRHDGDGEFFFAHHTGPGSRRFVHQFVGNFLINHPEFRNLF